MRAQLAAFGLPPVEACVTDIAREAGGLRRHRRRAALARRLSGARDGVEDVLPAIPDAAERVRQGLLRCCPICDAYEVRGRALAVIGAGDCAAGEALFLTAYSPRVTLVTRGGPPDVGAGVLERLRAAGVVIVTEPVLDIAAEAGGVRVILPERALRFDAVYAGSGSVPAPGSPRRSASKSTATAASSPIADSAARCPVATPPATR